jgi:hypothetical protein
MPLNRPKVVVVMPAYNAAKPQHMIYAALPRTLVDLVDDGSSDETARVALRTRPGPMWPGPLPGSLRRHRPGVENRYFHPHDSTKTHVFQRRGFRCPLMSQVSVHGRETILSLK